MRCHGTIYQAYDPILYQSLSAPSRKARQSTASIAASTSVRAIVFFLLEAVNDEDSAARLSTKSSVALEIRKTASCDAMFVSGSCWGFYAFPETAFQKRVGD